MTPIASNLPNIAALGFALLILWRAEPALARMSKYTHWMIRYAMLLLAGSALAIILTIASGASIASIGYLILPLLAGIALLLICERRLRFLTNRSGDRHA